MLTLKCKTTRTHHHSTKAEAEAKIDHGHCSNKVFIIEQNISDTSRWRLTINDFCHWLEHEFTTADITTQWVAQNTGKLHVNFGYVLDTQFT